MLSTALLSVSIAADDEDTPETTADVEAPGGGAIQIELPGRVMISVFRA